ncbi:glycosyltransferase BC10-like [Bidens hawaiensis]|uniref:glycosyltransferase BC10-like n=1 Tax=Bidens hawaiensis TaxID=980011 RepID=UPI00404AD03E
MSPTPLSLLCALLLPLAIVFTINDITTTTTVTTTRKTYNRENPISSPPKIPTTAPLPPPFIEKIDLDDNNNNNSTDIDINTNNNNDNDNDNDNDADDDNALFQLASQVNPNPTPGAPKKLAFMFLATRPLPLAPLWERYFNRTKRHNLYNIYIHSDPSLRHNLLYQGVFANRTIPSKPKRRHTPSLAAAHRRLLAHALLHDPTNYMFSLLSPSCIPLHSFDFTYKTLINWKRSFIELLEHEDNAWWRWAARGDTAMLPEVPFDEFRIGSQFSVLTRKHATVAVNDTRIWSKFKVPCLHENVYSCYPEESYLPTLMSTVDRSGCVAATLTFVEWKGGHGGHPRAFHGLKVGPELIRAIRRRRPRYGDEEINGSDVSVRKRNDPFLFARKFGSDTVGGLMDIADDVILRD